MPETSDGNKVPVRIIERTFLHRHKEKNNKRCKKKCSLEEVLPRPKNEGDPGRSRERERKTKYCPRGARNSVARGALAAYNAHSKQAPTAPKEQNEAELRPRRCQKDDKQRFRRDMATVLQPKFVPLEFARVPWI